MSHEPQTVKYAYLENHCFTIYIPFEPHYHPLLNNPIEISDDETLTDEFAN